MAAPAQELAGVKKKRALVEQAAMLAKTRRILEAADSIYRSPGPLPPLTGSRVDICRFGFWLADLGNVSSRLRQGQESWRAGEVHCRTELQRRGTLHLHCLCYVQRPRDAESPDARAAA